jgi:caffeoyl-CoA O-methyltransferase
VSGPRPPASTPDVASAPGSAAPPAEPRPVTPLAILAARLGELEQRLAADGAAPDLRDEVHRLTALASGLDPYLASCTTPESPALAAIAGRTRAQDWASLRQADGPGGLEQEMLSGHVEGQTLKLLVRLVGARRALDIGMFTGYSALAMAEALPPDGEVVACELDPGVAAIARRSFDGAPAGERITVELGPALATLHRLADAGASFDVAFIDADKGGYVEYLAVLLDRGLVPPGGLICADNTLFQGEAYLAEGRTELGDAIAAFNRAVVDDPRVEQVLLPLRDGLTLIHVLPARP